jgi:hypothetical protein
MGHRRDGIIRRPNAGRPTAGICSMQEVAAHPQRWLRPSQCSRIELVHSVQTSDIRRDRGRDKQKATAQRVGEWAFRSINHLSQVQATRWRHHQVAAEARKKRVTLGFRADSSSQSLLVLEGLHLALGELSSAVKAACRDPPEIHLPERIKHMIGAARDRL